MTITTTANAFGGSEKFTPVKIPGQELQLLVKNALGKTLGSITVSRVDRLDQTQVSVETGSRGKAIAEWLAVEGLGDEPIDTESKRASRSFENASADITFAPRGRAVYFLDQANQRRYRDLSVVLTPSQAS
jgi:hypothetical protein